MKAIDLDFDLPESAIALRPADPRDTSRLMVLRPDGSIEHRNFHHLPEYFAEGDLLLLNDTKVFPARLIGKKATGGKIDILLVKELRPGVWEILCRDRYSGPVLISEGFSGEAIEGRSISFSGMGHEGLPDLMEILWKAGQMPLPPYIKRKPDEKDKKSYQTVYASSVGSIAAPTAGLHFTDELMASLKGKGVIVKYLTLHVGTGTFRPLKAENIGDHVMDAEDFEIEESVIEAVREAKARKKKVISVGTTSTRAIEGLFSGVHTLADPGASGNRDTEISRKRICGTTNIFIYPGFRFQAIDSLITNFHLPRSTPLMLASAFAGVGNLMRAYKNAVSERYRFFSYGDAMLILK